MNLPFVKIAQNLNVVVSTVHRIYRLFEESATVDPLSPRKRLDYRRLDLRSELHVVGVILRTLRESRSVTDVRIHGNFERSRNRLYTRHGTDALRNSI